MTSDGYIIMVIVDSCILIFHLDCILQLKLSYYIATIECSRKSATTFGDLPDWSECKDHDHGPWLRQYMNVRPFVKGIYQWAVDSFYKRAVKQSFCIPAVVSMWRLQNNQSICRWFETPWHSCDINIMSSFSFLLYCLHRNKNVYIILCTILKTDI